MDTNNCTESLSKALKYSYPATAPKNENYSHYIQYSGIFLAQANTFLTQTSYM